MTTPNTSHDQPASTAALYIASDERLRPVLAAVTDWGAPTPCEGWAARDVVAHLIETERQFLGEHVDLDGDAGADGEGVADGEGAPLTDPAAAWAAHADRVSTALANPELAARAYAGFFGPTTIGATFETFYVFDLLVHRWDVARAAGVEARWDDGELDLLDAATAEMGDAIRMDGICGPEVAVSEGADRQTRMLGYLGRVG